MKILLRLLLVLVLTLTSCLSSKEVPIDEVCSNGYWVSMSRNDLIRYVDENLHGYLPYTTSPYPAQYQVTYNECAEGLQEGIVDYRFLVVATYKNSNAKLEVKKFRGDVPFTVRGAYTLSDRIALLPWSEK